MIFYFIAQFLSPTLIVYLGVCIPFDRDSILQMEHLYDQIFYSFKIMLRKSYSGPYIKRKNRKKKTRICRVEIPQEQNPIF